MFSFTRAIAHIDADFFFAAVELLDKPHLKGKPVLVCNRTDRRGIVVSSTYEARALGIKAGTPVFKAQTLCPNGIFIPTHFDRYQTISGQLIQLLKTFSPDVEPCSIDEAYIDLTGLRLLYRTDYRGIGERMQNAVHNKLGITISIGIASSKLLAKIASDFKKPAGLTVVLEKNREEFLKNIATGKVPGIGVNTEALLKKYGYATAFDIVAGGVDIEKILGSRGVQLAAELRGTSLSPVSQSTAPPQSLSNTRTFSDFSDDKKYIYSFSLRLLLSLTRRLRNENCEARHIVFFLLTKNFKSHDAKRRLEIHTNEDRVFIEIFRELFDAVFKESTVYRKSGFVFCEFRPVGPAQISLFESPIAAARGKVIDTVSDKIYAKYGSRGIFRGNAL